MKKFLSLALVAVLALGTIANGAEGDDKPRKRPDAKKARDGKGLPFGKLNLSDDQKAELAEIRKEFGPKFKEARENKDREAFGKLRKEMMAAVMNVLTDEQKEQLKKMRDGKKGPGKKGPGKGKGKKPAEG